eukprot:6340331-Alexandrium_andersonii.AAC.1
MPCSSAQSDCCVPSCKLDSTTPLSLLCADRGRSAAPTAASVAAVWLAAVSCSRGDWHAQAEQRADSIHWWAACPAGWAPGVPASACPERAAMG